MGKKNVSPRHLMNLVMRKLKSADWHTNFQPISEGDIGIANMTVMQIQHPKRRKIPIWGKLSSQR